MDIIIQQDGRIQTNIAIRPNQYEYRTVEYPEIPLRAQVSAEEYAPKYLNLIERRFRKLGTEGNITVWVEIR